MMSWLFEDTLVILFLVVVSEAILLGAWLQTGRSSMILAMVGTLILCGTALVIERFVVTDREAVVVTLEQIAQDLKKNEPLIVATHVASTAPGLRQQVERRMHQIEIKDADIKGRPEVTIFSQGSTKMAEADLKGLVVGSGRKGFLQDIHYFRRFIVRFRNEKGRWKIYEYEEQKPL